MFWIKFDVIHNLQQSHKYASIETNVDSTNALDEFESEEELEAEQGWEIRPKISLIVKNFLSIYSVHTFVISCT